MTLKNVFPYVFFFFDKVGLDIDLHVFLIQGLVQSFWPLTEINRTMNSLSSKHAHMNIVRLPSEAVMVSSIDIKIILKIYIYMQNTVNILGRNLIPSNNAPRDINPRDHWSSGPIKTIIMAFGS